MKRLTTKNGNGKPIVKDWPNYMEFDIINRLAAIEDILGDEYDLADVAPVRHGRWKNGGNGLYDTCTACGKEIYLAIPMNYCPECGALMDGKEADHD